MVKQLIAGVDMGNSSTEVALAQISDDGVQFLSQHLVRTSGVKGTVDNVTGIRIALEEAANRAGIRIDQIDKVRINDAAPVIGDLAMDLISETIITESSMIGHNPDTPGGAGLGVGLTVPIDELFDWTSDQDVIVVVPGQFDYEWVASRINAAIEQGIRVNGAIVQKDDGVLVYNRLSKKIPIVDEVSQIEKVPLGKLAVVEVALPGQVIRMASNPYGLATIFQLDPDTTIRIAPIAKALVGNRSAVVIRTPQGEVAERRIEAGKLTLVGEKQKVTVSVNDGSDAIMEAYEKIGSLVNVVGETATNVGGMLNSLRQNLAQLTQQSPSEITIRDLLAVDAVVPMSVSGAMAGELTLETGVAFASMVKTSRLPIQKVADTLAQAIGVPVEVGGVEAEMAIRGALTTPGTRKPIVILDMGGGSTDAAMMAENGKITSTHLAGAGDMVTMLIDMELGLNNKALAEKIKKYPLAKVMSMFHMQLEDGTTMFSDAPLPPDTFGRVVIREGKILSH